MSISEAKNDPYAIRFLTFFSNKSYHGARSRVLCYILESETSPASSIRTEPFQYSKWNSAQGTQLENDLLILLIRQCLFHAFPFADDAPSIHVECHRRYIRESRMLSASKTGFVFGLSGQIASKVRQRIFRIRVTNMLKFDFQRWHNSSLLDM